MTQRKLFYFDNRVILGLYSFSLSFSLKRIKISNYNIAITYTQYHLWIVCWKQHRQTNMGKMNDVGVRCHERAQILLNALRFRIHLYIYILIHYTEQQTFVIRCQTFSRCCNWQEKSNSNILFFMFVTVLN